MAARNNISRAQIDGNVLRSVVVLILFLVTTVIPQERKSFLSGIVTDAASGERLSGVNIFDVSEGVGTASDLLGNFKLELQTGNYTFKFSMIGYRDTTLSAIQISAGQNVVINIAMNIEAISLEGVIVTPKPKSYDASGISAKLDRNMVMKSPGSAQDIFWVLQTLPGISSGSDDSKIYVRGGSADENLVVYNGATISNPFHFEIMGGGLYSVFNSRLVKNVQFYSSGFPARFGDRLSSVLVINNKDGNYQNVESELNLSMSDLNAIVEFPIKSLNGGGIISIRRSYFDFVLGLISDLDGDYSVLPYFFDVDLKTDFQLNNNNKLSISYLQTQEEMTGIYDIPHFAGEMSLINKSALGGLKLTSMLGSSSINTLNIYYTMSKSNSIYPQASKENNSLSELGIKNDFSVEIGDHEMHAGFWALRKSDDVDIDLAGEVNFYTLRDLKIMAGGNYNLYSAYMEDRINFTEQITGNFGFRLDYLPEIQEQVFSPRINLVYRWLDHMSLTFDYGVYFQSPDPYQTNFRDIASKKSINWGLGLKHQFDESMIINVEYFRRDFSKLPLLDPKDWQYASIGIGDAQGIEFYFQYAPSESFVGWVSYTYSKSERSEDLISEIKPSSFDRTNLLNLVVQFIPYNDWNVGMKYRYASGSPFTPVASSISDGSSGWLPILGAQNSARYPAYSRLDVRISKKLTIKKTDIDFYFELLNLLNEVNVVHYIYNEDYTTKEPMTVLPIIPVLGINVTI